MSDTERGHEFRRRETFRELPLGDGRSGGCPGLETEIFSSCTQPYQRWECTSKSHDPPE